MTRAIAFICALGAFALACQSGTAPAQPDFGARYRVEWEPPPILDSNGLTVSFSYGACGGNRQFVVEHRVLTEGSVEVWLRKVTPDEPCDMLVTDRRTFSVDPTVRDAAVVMLLAPNDGAYQLRATGTPP